MSDDTRQNVATENAVERLKNIVSSGPTMRLEPEECSSLLEYLKEPRRISQDAKPVSPVMVVYGSSVNNKPTLYYETDISFKDFAASKPNGASVIIFRGHVSDRYLALTYEKYKVDPLFFARHVTFPSDHEPTGSLYPDQGEVPHLPSQSPHMFSLNAPGIFRLQHAEGEGNESSLKKLHTSYSNAWQAYKTKRMKEKAGSTIVRKVTLLNERHAIVDHRISLTIVGSDPPPASRHVIIWSDLAESLPGGSSPLRNHHAVEVSIMTEAITDGDAYSADRSEPKTYTAAQEYLKLLGRQGVPLGGIYAATGALDFASNRVNQVLGLLNRLVEFEKPRTSTKKHKPSVDRLRILQDDLEARHRDLSATYTLLSKLDNLEWPRQDGIVLSPDHNPANTEKSDDDATAGLMSTNQQDRLPALPFREPASSWAQWDRALERSIANFSYLAALAEKLESKAQVNEQRLAQASVVMSSDRTEKTLGKHTLYIVIEILIATADVTFGALGMNLRAFGQGTVRRLWVCVGLIFAYASVMGTYLLLPSIWWWMKNRLVSVRTKTWPSQSHSRDGDEDPTSIARRAWFFPPSEPEPKFNKTNNADSQEQNASSQKQIAGSQKQTTNNQKQATASQKPTADKQNQGGAAKDESVSARRRFLCYVPRRKVTADEESQLPAAATASSGIIGPSSDTSGQPSSNAASMATGGTAPEDPDVITSTTA